MKNKDPMPEIQGVDSKLYDKKYFESIDGAHYFSEDKTAPKFIYAVNTSGVTSGDSVLDIGCGRGDLMMALAQKGADVTGIDYSHEALDIAQKAIARQSAKWKDKIKVLHSNATALNFPDQTFDYVFMTDIVEHLYPLELKKCFEECKRVLNPRGRLIVHTAPNRWYNDFGYPFWEQPINKILNRLFRQNLLTRPIRTEQDYKVHINEQTILSLKKYLVETGFDSKIWLGSEYITPSKKDSSFTQFLEIFRQVLCHAYPLSLLPPLKYIFCNDIWAIAKKQ
ncbi:MAG: class I SAM-dependent methyltransferase [Nitrospina sp.]|nr:class I SAM-dependent methyltransferase [Nitrospina sp.]MBT5631134.1 class I SAM-dependent methyltransferase [Nitrospina sp.]